MEHWFTYPGARARRNRSRHPADLRVAPAGLVPRLSSRLGLNCRHRGAQFALLRVAVSVPLAFLKVRITCDSNGIAALAELQQVLVLARRCSPLTAANAQDRSHPARRRCRRYPLAPFSCAAAVTSSAISYRNAMSPPAQGCDSGRRRAARLLIVDDHRATPSRRCRPQNRDASGDIACPARLAASEPAR